MRRTKADILKTTSELSNTSVKDTTQEKVDAIVAIVRMLFVDNTKFSEVDTFNMLKLYISTYNRILYAPISNEIYTCFDKHNYDEAVRAIGTVTSNMEKLVAYTESSSYETRRIQTVKEDSIRTLDDTKKAVLKIWDHINLAQQQYNVLKQSDDEYKEKFSKLISSYKEDMTKDMSNQLLTMVSIFTALAFLVFCGISSLDSIFSSHGIPLLKLMCVGAIWGLCILNLIFVFLFCVGKMTKLNFQSTEDPDANVFQKYPVIWWTDLMLISILSICLWAYYVQQHSFASWFVTLCMSNQMLATIVGTLAIALIISLCCAWLAKKTSNHNKQK